MFKLRSNQREKAAAFLTASEEELGKAKLNLDTVKEHCEQSAVNEAFKSFDNGQVSAELPLHLRKKLKAATERVSTAEGVLKKARAEKSRLDAIHAEKNNPEKIRVAKAALVLAAMRSKASLVDDAILLLARELKDLKGLMDESEELCSQGDKDQVKKARKMVQYVIVRGVIEHCSGIKPPLFTFKTREDVKNISQHIPAEKLIMQKIHHYIENQRGGACKIRWPNLTAGQLRDSDPKQGDEGLFVNPINHNDFSVEIFGKFGLNGKVVIEGSDSENDQNPQTVLDIEGKPIIFDSIGKKWIGKHYKFYRPRVEGGDYETNLTAVLFCCYESAEKREAVQALTNPEEELTNQAEG